MNWIKITKESIPAGSGWFAVAVNPVNYADLDKKSMNDWRMRFGFSKLWLHNGKFWEDHKDVTHRCTHWSFLPKVPILRGR